MTCSSHFLQHVSSLKKVSVESSRPGCTWFTTYCKPIFTIISCEVSRMYGHHLPLFTHCTPQIRRYAGRQPVCSTADLLTRLCCDSWACMRRLSRIPAQCWTTLTRLNCATRLAEGEYWIAASLLAFLEYQWDSLASLRLTRRRTDCCMLICTPSIFRLASHAHGSASAQ